jgi:hypothetical protein
VICQNEGICQRLVLPNCFFLSSTNHELLIVETHSENISLSSSSSKKGKVLEIGRLDREGDTDQTAHSDNALGSEHRWLLGSIEAHRYPYSYKCPRFNPIREYTMPEAAEKPETTPSSSEGQSSRRPRRGGGEKTCYNCGKASSLYEDA